MAFPRLRDSSGAGRWPRFGRRFDSRHPVAAALLWVLLLSLASSSVRAHPTLNDRILILNRQIAASPLDPTLRLSRGSLYADEGHYAEALVDIEAVLRLDPGMHVAYLVRAQVLLATTELERAAAAVAEFLKRVPGQPRGWQAAARIAAHRGQWTRASSAYDRFFALATQPRPEDYLEHAAVLVAAGELARAVGVLEHGVDELGPLTALLQELVRLSLDSGDTAATLAYLDRLIASSPQTERWLLERATVLHAVERDREALEALQLADQSLDRRPAVRRNSGPLRELADSIAALRSEIDLTSSMVSRRSSP